MADGLNPGRVIARPHLAHTRKQAKQARTHARTHAHMIILDIGLHESHQLFKKRGGGRGERQRRGVAIARSICKGEEGKGLLPSRKEDTEKERRESEQKKGD
jgi:hypothetical protein